MSVLGLWPAQLFVVSGAAIGPLGQRFLGEISRLRLFPNVSAKLLQNRFP
jgi:hypothetical protein